MATIEVVRGVRYPFTTEYRAAIWSFKKEIEKARENVKTACYQTKWGAE